MNVRSVLILVTKSVLGGAQKYVATIAIGLPKERYNVTVAAASGGWLQDYLLSHQIHFIPIKPFKNETNKKQDVIDALFDFKAFWELYNIIKNGSYDIVHTNSTKAGIVGRIAATLAKVQTVIHTSHGLNLFEDAVWYKWRMIYYAEKLAGFFTDTFIAVCDKDKITAERYGLVQSDKIRRIYNGVRNNSVYDKKNQQNLRHPKLKAFDHIKLVGTVANYSQNKGLSYFIEAASIVLRSYPNVEFVIIGNCNNASILEKIKKLGLDKNVHLLGLQLELDRFLPYFDVFVLSSIKEGCPFALLEAMSFKLPIAATNVGGIPEIIQEGKSGLIVPPKDSQRMAKAILELLSNEKRANTLATQAKKRQQTKFTYEQLVDSTIQLYDKCYAMNGNKLRISKSKS